VTAAGVAERCELVQGDFFEKDPAGADAYIMNYILHDWEEERALAILRNCRKAMSEGGRQRGGARRCAALGEDARHQHDGAHRSSATCLPAPGCASFGPFRRTARSASSRKYRPKAVERHTFWTFLSQILSPQSARDYPGIPRTPSLISAVAHFATHTVACAAFGPRFEKLWELFPPDVSLSTKALRMRRTLPTKCVQSSSHSVNQAARPLRRDFSWS
jgi:hypothetical protein